MIPEIKDITSPDIENLETYKPLEPYSFCFLLELTIGARGEEGADLFQIKVCTPRWLLENNKTDDIILARHHVIMFKYDYMALRNKLEKLVHTCSGETWKDCAKKLSRIGHWEFEDYP